MLCIYRNLDGVGYCIMCDGVVSEEIDDTFTIDILEWLNESPPPKKKKNVES